MNDAPIEVGSIWHARDGRVVRVERIMKDPMWPFQKPRAELTVVNAESMGCRRKTTIGLDSFGVGRFLIRAQEGRA